jgi:hypothetical protein
MLLPHRSFLREALSCHDEAKSGSEDVLLQRSLAAKTRRRLTSTGMRHDDEEDGAASDEWDDDSDAGDESDDTTVACPFCGHEIFEDTPRCPACERYLSPEDFVQPRRPLWVMITSIVCLLIAIWLALVSF